MGSKIERVIVDGASNLAALRGDDQPAAKPRLDDLIHAPSSEQEEDRRPAIKMTVTGNKVE